MGKDKKNNEELLMLCNYIKTDILHYEDTMKLPPVLLQKLKALAYEKVDGKQKMIYTYKMILCSFMINKNKIDYAIQNKIFNGENHKINYIMTIVTSSMNDIKRKVLSYEHQEKIKEKNKNQTQYMADNGMFNNKDDRYCNKTEDITTNRTEDLWKIK